MERWYSMVHLHMRSSYSLLESPIRLESMILHQKQLGYNKKPIIILNSHGFYDKLNAFFEEIIEEKFANKNMRSIYYIAQTPQDAIDYLKNYKPSELDVDKNAIYAR